MSLGLRLELNTPRSRYPSYINYDAGETLIDLGNPEAHRYIEEFLVAAVEKYELDVWRVDFNIDPGPVWYRKWLCSSVAITIL